MKPLVIKDWFLVVAVLADVRMCQEMAGCQTVEVSNSNRFDGTYARTEDMCTKRPIYERTRHDYVLYFADGYWLIDAKSKSCHRDGTQTAYSRVKDSASYPERIVEHWQEKYYGYWCHNMAMCVYCRDGGTHLHDNEVFGILIGCCLTSLLIIVISVGWVKAAKERRKQIGASSSNNSLNLQEEQPSNLHPVTTFDNPGFTHPEGNSCEGHDLDLHDFRHLSDLPSYDEAVNNANKDNRGIVEESLPPSYESSVANNLYDVKDDERHQRNTASDEE